MTGTVKDRRGLKVDNRNIGPIQHHESRLHTGLLDLEHGLQALAICCPFDTMWLPLCTALADDPLWVIICGLFQGRNSRFRLERGSLRPLLFLQTTIIPFFRVFEVYRVVIEGYFILLQL